MIQGNCSFRIYHIISMKGKEVVLEEMWIVFNCFTSYVLFMIIRRQIEINNKISLISQPQFSPPTSQLNRAFIYRSVAPPHKHYLVLYFDCFHFKMIFSISHFYSLFISPCKFPVFTGLKKKKKKQ